MPTTYAAALEALFRAPHADFVAERARLAAELAKARDHKGSTKLAKQRRPGITAWAVNQLWWSERALVKELLRTGERLRDADLSATVAHRKALSKLRERAAGLLAGAGHAATEGTLRRVTATLSALAATGGFAPDAPGTLRFDRDPPGFGAVNPKALEKLARRPRPKAAPGPREKEAASPSKAELAAERRRLEREQAVRKAERERVGSSLRTAKLSLEKQELELRDLRGEVERRERTLTETKQKLKELEQRRRVLGD